ncbi:ferritin-like domain-containing protein [Rhodovibrio salinarum]|uniref:Ferritin/DPS domain-containing protein n=1 Tax=Rhodovibrio salinarum TaxID=1087 RepID=A0A934V1D3_9PROT|nr:ferritin-like domain-containing protein [Rhodovibrio salinarum]MBK1698515.1 hypothetical protein [Rhodovibrio salinarum]
MTVITQLDTASGLDTAGNEDPGAQVAQALSRVAGEAAVVRLKIQALRWQYAGLQRRALEDLLIEREGELSRLLNTAAVRLRTLGYTVPIGLTGDRANSSISLEAVDGDHDAQVRSLCDDIGHLIASCRTTHAIAQTIDARTADRLAEQIRTLEKSVWMLSAQASHD